MLEDEHLCFINNKLSDFKQTPNYKLQNNLRADTLKKSPKYSNILKKKKDRKTFCYITDKLVLVTAQNKKHLDQNKN